MSVVIPVRMQANTNFRSKRIVICNHYRNEEPDGLNYINIRECYSENP
jgi:hypothetical protein